MTTDKMMTDLAERDAALPKCHCGATDTATLAGMRIHFTDGCEGTITGRLEPFARVRSLPSAPHQHDHEYAWETVAREYIDKGRPFPVR